MTSTINPLSWQSPNCFKAGY